jgi:diguanylate cyclase (GGDEF)-like protein
MDKTFTELPADFIVKILDACPSGILVTDKAEKIIWCNSTLTRWLNISKDQAIGSMLNQFLQKAFQVMEQHPQYLTILDDNKKPVKWLQHTTLQMTFSDGIHHVVYLNDINAQIEIQNRLEQLETIEPVSGLLNRRAMLLSLDPLVSRSRRYHNPLSIIAIELLNLPQIRKEHGQDTADHCMLEVSHLLKDQLRWADIISRIDDNNVIIILPETEKQDTTNLASKVSHQVAELNIEHNNFKTTGLDACYGVTSWEKGFDSMLLLKNANNALDEAKAKGIASIVTK